MREMCLSNGNPSITLSAQLPGWASPYTWADKSQVGWSVDILEDPVDTSLIDL